MTTTPFVLRLDSAFTRFTGIFNDTMALSFKNAIRVSEVISTARFILYMQQVSPISLEKGGENSDGRYLPVRYRRKINDGHNLPIIISTATFIFNMHMAGHEQERHLPPKYGRKTDSARQLPVKHMRKLARMPKPTVPMADMAAAPISSLESHQDVHRQENKPGVESDPALLRRSARIQAQNVANEVSRSDNGKSKAIEVPKKVTNTLPRKDVRDSKPRRAATKRWAYSHCMLSLCHTTDFVPPLWGRWYRMSHTTSQSNWGADFLD